MRVAERHPEIDAPACLADVQGELRSSAIPFEAFLRRDVLTTTNPKGLTNPASRAGRGRSRSASGPPSGPSSGRPRRLSNAPDIATAQGAARPRRHRRAARLRAAWVRGGGAHRWALFRRIHDGGDGRRAAREQVAPVGMVTGRIASAIFRPRFFAPCGSSAESIFTLRPVIEYSIAVLHPRHSLHY